MEGSDTHIVVLGGLRIERAGADTGAALPGRRSELVFAYLAAEHRRTVGRDELADALWPDLLPDSWAAALRGVVSEVRRFLDDAGLDGHELLAGARGGYRLALPAGVTVDLDEARAALADARAQLDGDPARAAGAATRAAALAQLPFLPLHEGAWVDAIRDELGALRSAALELAARAHLTAKDHRAALAAAEGLVRAEPFSEAAHRLLIGVLGEAGDTARAARAYEHCRSVLREELGVQPSAETEAALQQALASRAAAPAPDAAPAPAAAPGRAPAAATGASALADHTVLVVEDHDFQRRTAVSLLRRLGVGTVLEAGDGAAALALLAGGASPDIIICDLDMPGMDGVEFIRRAARDKLAGAVVIASGLDRRILDTVRTVGEGYGLQVLGAVEKPLTARKLADLLAGYRRPAPPAEGDGPASLTAAEIADALARGHVAVELEPIADLATGRIGAAEVVVRWTDPHRGLLRAASLESADPSGGLAEHVFALGCAAAGDALAAGLGLEIAMALPRGRTAGTALPDRLAQLAGEASLDPRAIVLEIGAGALKGEDVVALDVLARLRVKGFGLWLDDAGGEPLAPEQLARIPLTGIRLAPGLLRGAVGDPARAAALAEAVELARGLALPCIGAGCDDAAQLELLLELGASHVQGAVVGEAMPARALADWAAGWTPPSLVADDAP